MIKKYLKRTIVASVMTLSFVIAHSVNADAGMSEGTVKKIDISSNKITLKHGPLDNLSMPPMTMVFAVADGVSLDGLKVGDTVEFVAVDKDGSLIIEKIEQGH